MNIKLKAISFAMKIHAEQVRKYTGNPYSDHLFEVAGIVSMVDSSERTLITALLHDSMEDQGVTWNEIALRFGEEIASGVQWLSDLETGNRATRKRLSRERLALAPDWVQNIKVADLISNTSSIVKHDPKFAVTYLEEKRLLLDVLTKADPELRDIARGICS